MAKFGGLGSAHTHAAFLVKIDGSMIDFSQPKYQVQSPYIHVENNDGFTLHRHALTVPFGGFLRSVNMDIMNSCFYNDSGQKFCDNVDGKRLQFFVNGVRINSIMDYTTTDSDRILVLYGNEDQSAISGDLELLNSLTIQRLE